MKLTSAAAVILAGCSLLLANSTQASTEPAVPGGDSAAIQQEVLQTAKARIRDATDALQALRAATDPYLARSDCDDQLLGWNQHTFNTRLGGDISRLSIILLASEAALASDCQQEQPALVGASFLFAGVCNEALDLAQVAKEVEGYDAHPKLRTATVAAGAALGALAEAVQAVLAHVTVRAAKKTTSGK